MNIQAFGQMKTGETVDRITLSNSNGMSVELLNIGAAMRSLLVPDKKGQKRDVITGYDRLRDYEKNFAGFGATIGRYANRIAGASFLLNGERYLLTPWKEEGMPSLHSFPDCYAFRAWNYSAERENGVESVRFFLDSPDGDQGFPGHLLFSVTYRLTEENELILEYNAETDRDTLLNPTNHTYFNLDGHHSGTVLEHKLYLNSDRIPVYDDRHCPTGDFTLIQGTAFDFREEKTIGRDIFADEPLLQKNYGYDFAYAVNGGERKKEPALVAILRAKESGISMEVHTDMPSVQLYTANYLDETDCKDGASYGQYAGCCLETGFFPNAINTGLKEKAILRSGEHFHSVTVYKFRT